MWDGDRSTTGTTGRVRGMLVAASALVVLVTAGGAQAGAGGSAPGPAVDPDPAVRVSTSPDGETPTPRTAARSARGPTAADDAAALTRAAARQRIQTISPAPWLSGFGAVSVELRE